jgi:hypothetical protein
MKTRWRLFLFSVALVLASGSRSKKADFNTSVAALGEAFPTAVVQSSGQTRPSVANRSTRPDANDLVKVALSAARTDDYASGMIELWAAQARPGLTADQVMAAQRAKQARVEAPQRGAVNGDQKAIAELDAIKKTRS